MNHRYRKVSGTSTLKNWQETIDIHLEFEDANLKAIL